MRFLSNAWSSPTTPCRRIFLNPTVHWNGTKRLWCLFKSPQGATPGLGYTYADSATAKLIHDTLKALIVGADAMAPASAYMTMWRHIRNLGRPGICSLAISAVDCALWDLKAKLLDLPMVTLLGQVRRGAPIYGSGGFISYSDAQLASQLSGWVKEGIPASK